MTHFLNVDTGITLGYFVMVLLLGLWSGTKIKTVEDYATGGKSYSSFFIFATLSASFIGGGFTTGLSEKVFTYGLAYVIGLWGFSLKELLVATVIAPKMGRFSRAVSVGDIMEQLYGQAAKILTGIASVLVCAGIAGAQFSAFGYVLNILTGFPHTWGIALGAAIVIAYAAVGGMKAVVLNDTVHFCTLIVILPLTLAIAYFSVGGWEGLQASLPATHLSLSGDFSLLALVILFANFFLGETLVPPYVQRLLIGRQLSHVVKGTLWSGLVSIPFFLGIGVFGLIARVLDPSISPDLALPFVIKTVLPVGLKGLAIAAMMAVVMSSADAFLNAAGIAMANDVLKPILRFSGQQALVWSRGLTLVVGVIGTVFALSTESVIEILLKAYNFWTPFILVPLVLGILGYVVSRTVFWTAAVAGVVSTCLWEWHVGDAGNAALALNGAIVGVLFNAAVIALGGLLGHRKSVLSETGTESESETATLMTNK